MYATCMWRFLRGAPLLAGVGFAVAACGQPQAPANPTGEALPPGYGGQSGVPTARPPSLTRTPFPTYPARIYTTPVPTNPNPAQKPTPGQPSTPLPTPRPEDP